MNLLLCNRIYWRYSGRLSQLWYLNYEIISQRYVGCGNCSLSKNKIHGIILWNSTTDTASIMNKLSNIKVHVYTGVTLQAVQLQQNTDHDYDYIRYDTWWWKDIEINQSIGGYWYGRCLLQYYSREVKIYGHMQM